MRMGEFRETFANAMALRRAGIVLIFGLLVFGCKPSGPSVGVTIRIAVTPAGQLKFVASHASSARFKYVMAKQSGVQPVVSQKLSVKEIANSAELEAAVHVETKEQGERYANG